MSCTLRVSPGPGERLASGSRTTGRDSHSPRANLRGASRAVTPPSSCPSLPLTARIPSLSSTARIPSLLSTARILSTPSGQRGAGAGSLRLEPLAAADGTPVGTAPAADPEPLPTSAEAPSPAPSPEPPASELTEKVAPKAAARGGGAGGGAGGLQEMVLHPGVALGLHVASAGLVALSFFNGSLFGYHPTLMAASFLLLMPEALLSAIRGGVGKGRKTAVVRHALLNSGAMAAALWGLAAIWVNKERMGKPHIRTLHAAVGAAAFALSSLVATGGTPLMLGFPPALKKMGLPKIVYDAHKQFGFGAYLLGVAACVLGLQTFKPAHPLHKGALTYAVAAMSVLSAALVWASVLKKRGGKGKAKA